MNQFTTTTVFNSVNAKDYNGVDLVDGNGSAIPAFTGSATKLDVAKVGSFKKANITGLYKRPYVAGVLETATLVVPGNTAGDVLKLVIDINLSGATSSDYVSSTVEFDKKVIVEVLGTGTNTTTATALTNALNAMKNRFGLSYLTATVSGATITLKAKDASQRFASIKLTKVTVSGIDVTETEVASGTITANGASGFGDDLWMIQSVVIPTGANTDFFGTNKLERPEMGGNYTQYILHYSIDNPADLKGTFSGAKSNTTHVFWVKNGLVAGVETELKKLGVPFGATIEGLNTVVVGATITLSFAGTGAITWTTSAAAKATVADGVVTGVAAGTADITATDAIGNTATITVTVEAA